MLFLPQLLCTFVGLPAINMPITSYLQHLIVHCSRNVGGMEVPSLKLEVDGEPIFLKRRVLPCGQREGILKALQKMEQDGVISKVEFSAWATPIVVAMKPDVTRQLGQAMVEVTDLNDATVHKRYVDQIHFKPSTDQRHKETTERDNQLHIPSVQPTEPHQLMRRHN
ncbi:unnamed protein product [Echinostoma caproni]|uniref:Uncharacterized protein n=1 Tax=Echinostoma caproni TaxID=27848 RepID=A0A183AXZ5_9TREM|nr:unnamed protein product [Echinostoma caproni]